MTDPEKRVALKRKLTEAKESALIRRQAAKAIKLEEKKTQMREKRAAARAAKTSKPLATNSATSLNSDVEPENQKVDVSIEDHTIKSSEKPKVLVKYRGKKNAKSSADRRRENREKQSKFIARIKADPAKHELYKQKERERYMKRKADGKLLMIASMPKRAKRQKRKQWRTNTRAYRARIQIDAQAEKFVASNSPPSTPTTNFADNPLVHGSGSSDRRKTSGRKKVRRDRVKAYRQLQKKELELKNAHRQIEKYRKRLQRLKRNQSSGATGASPSPRTKVTKLLGNQNVSNNVRKELIFSAVLQKQLKHNLVSSGPINARQRMIATAVSGSLIQKYRQVKRMQKFCSWKWFTSARNKIQAGVWQSKKRQDAISDCLKKKVVDFYQLDCNSRMCSGKKDCITRGKLKQQKRLLTDTIENLYSKFTAMNSEKLSYASFCILRPFWVIQPRIQDRNTCLCMKHDNVQFLLDRLHCMKIIGCTSVDELCRSVSCDSISKVCAYGECIICKHKQVKPLPGSGDVMDKQSFYYKWSKQKQTRPSHKGGEIKVIVTTKLRVTGTGREMLLALNKCLPEFVKHCYRISHQYNFIKNLKDRLTQEECILHIDFSENYVCKYSQEAQSVHFGASQQQASLHTGVLYTASKDKSTDGTAECMSFCSMSDNTRHDPAAIWAHLQPVLNMISEKYPEVHVVHFLSDGPTSQYRNRTNMYLFSQLSSFGPFECGTWNYSESGHGKGAADGIGGSLKRMADRLVAQGRDIATPKSLFDSLNGQTKTNLFYITSEDISKVEEVVKQLSLKQVNKTMSIHQIVLRTPQHIETRYLSCTCSGINFCTHYLIEGDVCILNQRILLYLVNVMTFVLLNKIVIL